MMSFNALLGRALAESLQIEATDPAIPANMMTMSPMNAQIAHLVEKAKPVLSWLHRCTQHSSAVGMWGWWGQGGDELGIFLWAP